MDDDASNLSTFDIYSDLLLERQNQGVSVEQLEKTNVENEAKLKELMEQLQNLETQNAAVLEENKVLKTNISTLFKTAQAELRRKDRQLEEQAERRPRYWRESDHNSSINDRLRDLRNNPRAYPRRTNGMDYGSSREVVPDSRRSEGSSESRWTGDVRKPWKQDGEDKGSRSRGDAKIDRKRTPLALECNTNVLEETTGDRHDRKHPEISTISKDTDNLSTHSADGCSKDNDSCSIHSERTESERNPNKRSSLSNYRIPQKSSSTYDRPLSSREATGRVISPEPKNSDHRPTDQKRSSRQSTQSPSRHTRGKDEKQHRTIRSPLHGHSSERSKSREKLSQYSDRGANRSSVERHPGRKRRLSPERGNSTSYDSHQDYKSHGIAPRKKHKGESSYERKLPQGVKTHRNDSCSDQEATICVAPKKRHRSRTSSHKKKKFPDASLADEDEDSRKRHKSDRKKKSLKRAKETLHKMHTCSTPKKHTKHKKDDSKKQKHRKKHSSKKHKKKDKTKNPDAMPDLEGVSDNDLTVRSRRKKMLLMALEDGEMRGGSIDGTVEEDAHDEKEPNDLGVVRQDISTCANSQASSTGGGTVGEDAHDKKEPNDLGVVRQDNSTCANSQASSTGGGTVGEDAHDEKEPNDLDVVRQDISTCADSQASSTDEAKVNQEPSGQDSVQNCEDLKNVAAPEIDEESNNEENVISVAEEGSNQSDFVLKDVKDENLPKYKTRQTDHLYDYKDSNGVMKDRNDDTTDTEGKLPSLRQPDSTYCEYSSEHETILVCIPSQEDDSTSESASLSASSTSLPSCQQNDSKHQIVLHQSEDESGVQLRPIEGLNAVSSSEDDGTLWNYEELRMDMSGIQAQETGDVNKSESSVKQKVPIDSGTEPEQAMSKSDNLQNTKVLKDISKPVQLPIGNSGDSFSEKILDVFGSTSFLESDDLQSSKEAQISLHSTDSFSFQPKDSSPCALQRSPVGDVQHSAGNSQPPVKHNSFSETVLNVFGSNNFLESDDLDSSIGVLSIASQTETMLQTNLAATTKHPSSAKAEQTTRKQQTKAGSLKETIFEMFGNNSFVDDDKQGMGVVTASSLLTDQPIIQAEESRFGIVQSCASISPKMEMVMGLSPREASLNHGHDKAQVADFQSSPSEHDNQELSVAASQCHDNSNLASETEDMNKECSAYPPDVSSIILKRDDESNPDDDNEFLSDKTDKDASIRNSLKLSDTYLQCPDKAEDNKESTPLQMDKEPENQYFSVEDVADISINPPSFDALSCSASPAHSLLGDSENSCHSNRDDQNDSFGKGSDKPLGDFENSDQSYQSDGEGCSQSADQCGNDTPSETNLSDGEIISSSDAEAAPPLKTSTHQSGSTDRRTKLSKSSRNRSRSRDKQTSSRKDRDHSSKHGRDRRTEDHDRTRFFEKKLKILEERLKARKLESQQFGYHGSKSTSDRQHESHSLKRQRLESRDRKGLKDVRNEKRERIEPRDRKGLKDENNERGDRQGKSHDHRYRESRQGGESEGSGSRHTIKAHSSRRYDIDQQERQGYKPESGKLTLEERKRSRHHRR